MGYKHDDLLEERQVGYKCQERVVNKVPWKCLEEELALDGEAGKDSVVEVAFEFGLKKSWVE